MRKRVEEDEVVTAWRVVKRRMAKGAARARRGRVGGAQRYTTRRGSVEGTPKGTAGGRAGTTSSDSRTAPK